MESLCYSANKGSDDAYDVYTSLTFSEASQKLLKDANQTEIFELFENTTKVQCPDCNFFTQVGIIYCRCGRNMKYNRSPKPNLGCTLIDGYIIKKNSSRGPERGPSERQLMLFKAKDMLRKAKKNNTTILTRLKAEERYRGSLKEHDIGEKEIIFTIKTLWRNTTFQLRELHECDTSQKWVVSLNAASSQPPRPLRPDYEAAQRECQRLQESQYMAETKQLYTPIHPNKDIKIGINNSEEMKIMTTWLIGKQNGNGFKSNRETCRAYFVFVVFKSLLI